MSVIRVLHVVTYMGRGGIETMLMNYYRNIDREKVQFDFLTHREFRADYDDEIESLGGKIYRLPKMNPWDKNYKKALDEFFKNHPEYRVVHVHRNSFSSIVLKAAKNRGVPVRIAHSHCSNEDQIIKRIIKRYYGKQIPNYATELFACGKDAGKWMFGKNHFTIVNNAINVDDFSYNSETAKSIRKELHISEDALVYGHVSNFTAPKNQDFLIDVFFEIQKKEKKARLILVGDGVLREKIETKVNNLGLSDSVIFLGKRCDVNRIMQGMDGFIFPSLHEGIGVVVIEAQASGLPCYISDSVPDEAMITELVTKLPLADSAESWANIILNQTKKFRKNTKEEIIKAGYDIVENAKWLQDYYVNVWNEVV